jgi:hypothetical protein
MSDKEMFLEYDKLRKRSLHLRKRLKLHLKRKLEESTAAADKRCTINPTRDSMADSTVRSPSQDE